MTEILIPILALFWVVQLVISIVLFRKLTAQVNKRDSEEKYRIREEKLFRLYQNLEEMMDTFEDFVNGARQDMNLERRELTELSRQAQAMFYQSREQIQSIAPERNGRIVKQEDLTQQGGVKRQSSTPSTAAERPVKQDDPEMDETDASPKIENKKSAGNGKNGSKLTQKDRDAVRKFSTKAQKVRYLTALGLTVDEVAKELDIGIGEVKLISDLDK